MEERLYRGKRIDNGEWVVGQCIKSHSKVWIIADKANVRPRSDRCLTWLEVEGVEVDPETVGQQIGRKNKAGVDLYEGQKIKIIHNWCGNELTGTIMYYKHECSYGVTEPDGTRNISVDWGTAEILEAKE